MYLNVRVLFFPTISIGDIAFLRYFVKLFLFADDIKLECEIIYVIFIKFSFFVSRNKRLDEPNLILRTCLEISSTSFQMS